MYTWILCEVMAKRLFDVLFSLTFLFLLFWLMIIVWLFAVIDTKTMGFFTQERIGYQGKIFIIYKIRTIQVSSLAETIVITKTGRILRKYKLDELPQLFNVLKGDMSIVGPRPDVSGFYDLLKGENRKILDLKPGLTSLAAIKYFNEEYFILENENPRKFNDEVLFPDKVRLNLEYYYNHTFFGDIKIIGKTILKTTTISEKNNAKFK